MATPISVPGSFQFPSTPAEAVALSSANTEFISGATDVTDRMRRGHGPPRSALVHLRRIPQLRSLTRDALELRLGAGFSLADLVEHRDILAVAPLLAEAAFHTATPQIRNMATVGGALFQRPRCAYYRDPEVRCLKLGGTSCLAKEGDHHGHAIFHTRTCIAPHPSTLAAALIALDASAVVVGPTSGKASGLANEERVIPLEDLFVVDESDPTSENALPTGALLTEIVIPIKTSPGAQVYRRASARALADWADVEVAIRIDVVASAIREVRVVLGGVGRVPVRAVKTENALLNQTLTTTRIADASRQATAGAQPLLQNQWKMKMTQSLVEDALLAIFDQRTDGASR